MLSLTEGTVPPHNTNMPGSSFSINIYIYICIYIYIYTYIHTKTYIMHAISASRQITRYSQAVRMENEINIHIIVHTYYSTYIAVSTEVGEVQQVNARLHELKQVHARLHELKQVHARLHKLKQVQARLHELKQVNGRLQVAQCTQRYVSRWCSARNVTSTGGAELIPVVDGIEYSDSSNSILRQGSIIHTRHALTQCTVQCSQVAMCRVSVGTTQCRVSVSTTV